MSKRKTRFFPNNLEDYKPDSMVKVDNENWVTQIKQLISEIINHVQKDKSTDGGLYVGSIGIGYMLCYAAEFEPLFDQKILYLNMAEDILKYNQGYFSRHPPRNTDKTSFLLGSVGLSIFAAYLGALMAKPDLVNENLNHLNELEDTYLRVNFLSCGSDELFVGRAGYLCGIYFLKNALKNKSYVKSSHFTKMEEITHTMILSGRSYASKTECPTPLLYSYYDTVYLGAAHGLSSILQMVLQNKNYIYSHPKEMGWIKDTVDWLLKIQQSNGNIAPALDEVAMQRSDMDELVHWCHGAPGVVYLFAKAYMIWKEEKYLEACLKCGDLTWEKGLLSKGPGICHGVAGNGYVFLLLYRLTKDKKHLHRAIQFANFILTEEFQRKARTPDCPFSLYEGLSGTVCFFIDLLQPDKAVFPFFNVFQET